MAAHVRLEVATQDLSNHSTHQVVKVRPGTVVNIKGSEKLFGNTCSFLFSASFSSHWPGTEMEEAIKIAQIQKRPKNISANKIATKQRK